MDNKIQAQGLFNQAANYTNFRPIVFDLDGDGLEFIPPGNGVRFDINTDGVAERIGWVATDDGLLVFDRNGDGAIDHVDELFCDGFFGGFHDLSLEEQANGVNEDRIINGADSPLFGELQIWKDANSDGIVQAGELSSLAANGITSLDIRHETVLTDNRWLKGNYIHHSGSFTRSDATTGDMSEVAFCLAGDANFISSGGVYMGDDPDLLALPQSRGFGNLPSWQDAIAANPTLRAMIEDFAARTEYSGVDTAVTEILWEWAGVTDFEPIPDNRDPFDPRNIRFMEELFRLDYQWDTASPGQRHLVMKAWELLHNDFKGQLLVQGPLKHLFPQADYHLPLDRISLNEGFLSIVARVHADPVSDNPDFLLDFRNILLRQKDELGIGEADINHYAAIWLSRVWADESMATTLLAMFNSGAVVTAEAETLWDFIGLTYVFEGAGHDELILGGDGDDRLEGNGGADVIYGGDGDDIIANGVNYEFNHLNPPSDNDSLFGGNGNDRFTLNGRNLFVNGDAGDDIIISEGSGYFRGGEGNDTITATFTAEELIWMDGGDGDDLLRVISDGSFAYLIGGAGNDTLYGDTGDDLLADDEGNDVMYGGAGDDTLAGGVGDDSLTGGEGKDSLDGYDGDDTLYGGEGHDKLNGGRGADMLYGDVGSATASYLSDTAGVHIDLGREGVQSGGEAEGDVLVNIRGIIGGSGDDLIIGTEGNHTLNGSWGDDTLDGGDQADLLTGGEGADVFRFSSLEHSRLPYDSDRITDFVNGMDRFDLSGLGFHHITADAVTEVGELRVEYHNGITYVLSDQVDFGFRLNGDHMMHLTDDDFLF